MLLDALITRDPIQIAMAIVASVFMVFFAMPAHECAHGLVAHWLGDDTAKNQGRLTLDPKKHISPLGAVSLLLIGFGWGNPCPVDERNFKHPKADMAVTALAGPLSNLLTAYIMIFFMVLTQVFGNTSSTFITAVYYFFYIAAQISVFLAVFNLFPIPPLDGYRILSMFLPDKAYYWFIRNENVLSIIFIVLIMTGALSGPLSSLSTHIINAFYSLAVKPFT